MSDSASPSPRARRGLFSVAQIQHIQRVEFQRAQRYRYPVSCLVVSVDQLGLVRDRAGYDEKERTLDLVVEALSGHTRSSDFLGRTADDRLVAVLPHTSAAAADRLAGRLLGLARDRVTPVGPLSLSIGGATADGPGWTFHDALLAAAEAAQSEATGSGGDRYVAAEAPALPEHGG